MRCWDWHGNSKLYKLFQNESKNFRSSRNKQKHMQNQRQTGGSNRPVTCRTTSFCNRGSGRALVGQFPTISCVGPGPRNNLEAKDSNDKIKTMIFFCWILLVCHFSAIFGRWTARLVISSLAIKFVWLGSSITPQREGVLAAWESRSSGSKVKVFTNRWPTNISGGHKNRTWFGDHVKQMCNKHFNLCTGKVHRKQMH